MPASTFKATCLAVMDQVQRNHLEVTITKHRKPVARLVPATVPDVPFIGRSAGMIDSSHDLVAPTSPDWEVDADL
jgi:prevent-host-death family protein